ncbi:MAG TPA: FtsX-like permease family protein [Candidatus Hydrogenedentes bacterium]|nr:FtsX-like permease family protein [Candidatus Hydrogenedentota bacterium]HPG65737.1 FtsX-like permease family protein [Candidatus Hydrogenedentota bacterium]
MSVWRLIRKEMGYRKLDFVLGVVAVLAAVACLVAVMTLLRGHNLRLIEMNETQVAETSAMLDLAADDYRKLMKEFGYNVVILSKDEDLTQFYADGFATKYMPEEFVSRLANSPIRSLQHLLPTLHRRVEWPEQDGCPIILIGVRGEVPHLNDNKGEPMIEPVEPGAMQIGSALHDKLGLSAGDEVVLMGKAFQIASVHDERGTSDDIGVWIHLKEAQELLGRPDEVSAVFALSCICVGGIIQAVRDEIGAILPESQVVQRMSDAYIRYATRSRLSDLAKETKNKEAEYHARQSREREGFAAWLIPLVIVVATLWIGLLALGNVRARRTEIGILRALGMRSIQILGVFLGKALALGLIGAVAGYLIGFGVGAAWANLEGIPLAGGGLMKLFEPLLVVGVLALAPLQACVASWIPAMMAAQQDPATILQEE